MKVEYFADSTQAAGFKATPEDQDGFPRVNQLQVALPPIKFSGQRKALAGALAFAGFTSGKLSVPDKMSPLTGSLVQELLGRREVFIDTESLEFKPTDIPAGRSSLRVCVADSLNDAMTCLEDLESSKDSNSTGIIFVKNDGVKGHISTPRFRIIPSNFWLVRTLESDWVAFLSLCSLALMYSEDLDAGSLVFDENIVSGNAELNETIRFALYSVGIKMETA